MIANAALEKIGEEIKIFDLAGLTDMTDYFVIVTGNGNLHVKAIVDHIQDNTVKVSKPWHVEGYESLKWVLLDYVDVVVHVFDRTTREYYDIERLWADADISSVSD
ncbi:MAG: ribosome silencing factor [Candidatus Marinimicrobia bacterium]|nr:ribosome silencing factor [Candidatus Neomarinimicrobiota bacterium]